METITAQDGKTMLCYGFAEKYFDIAPEGRIRRRQYFGRGLGGAILVGCLFLLASVATIPLMFLVGGITASLITLFLALLQSGTSLWMSYALGTKRIHDIGSHVGATKKIFYSTLGLWGVLTIGSQVTTIFSSDVLLQFSFLLTPLLLINVVLALYMLLMPGKTGDNEFGKDPMGTKLGFFG
jgi:uncharacterized membrane protein YhaH (DUF805 family)